MSHRTVQREVRAAAPQERTQARTGALVASSQDALVATLERIAALHADLASAYRDLAVGAGDIQLAVSGPQSDLDAMPPTTTPMPGPGKLLTAEQMAELLSVTEKTVRRWEAEGQIPRALRLANVVRWDASVVERWLAEEARS